jgi:hypothetical protein
MTDDGSRDESPTTGWIPAGLEGVALRLARADEATYKIIELSIAWARQGEHGPISVHQREVEPGIVELVVDKVWPVPPLIAMLFSEAIHHLRAAIDNTVFHLLGASEVDPKLAHQIAFPITPDEPALDRWFQRTAGAKLILADYPTLASRIRRLQPFESSESIAAVSDALAALMGVSTAKAHPLLLLQGYSNEDKHRSIRTGAGRSVVHRDDEPFLTSDRTMRPISPGDVLARAPIGRTVFVDANSAVHIQRPGGAHWVSPGRELDHLREYVSCVAIPTLITGEPRPNAFPPEIDLGDNGLSDRERIKSGQWPSAEMRARPKSRQAFVEAMTSPPQVPPLIPLKSPHS